MTTPMHESQSRRVLRALLTKEAKTLEELLSSGSELLRSEVVAKLKSLNGRYERLVKANEEVEQTLMGTPQLPDDELALEWERCTEYEVRYLYVRDLAEEHLEKTRVVSLHSNSSVDGQNGQLRDVSSFIQHRFLPEITRKFDGNVGNWIGFWTQFHKIHISERWTDDDKFDILLKGLKPDSAAANLISRFPPSAENYNKAVELLKSRFGRDENLIEFYVRKLLSLVLTRTDNRPVSELYDELEVQLQALDSLRVTKEKYAAMLFPLVESAVPEPIFRVWERHRVAKEASMKEPADCLSALLSFLRTEVEGEERLKLRKGNFSDGSKTLTPKSPDPEKKVESAIPTAASLVSTESTKVREVCIFCDKSHLSQECAAAADMTLTQRNEIVKKKGACFKCLKKTGHLSSTCKYVVKCVICKGRHFPLMCQRTDVSTEIEKNRDAHPESTPTLLSGGKTQSGRVTFLQTLVAKVVVGDKEIFVRVLLDSGSQKSYILKSCIRSLRVSRQSRVLIQQEVFGGSRTSLSSHSVYNIKLRSFDDSFEGDFEVLDQDRICSFVPQLHDVALFNKLKERGILLSDFSEASGGQACSEIQVLLGADAWARVLSSNHVEVEPGLLAINTRLGWTILGSTNECTTIASSLLVSLTCHVHLSNFWDLELLGIRDSAVQITREEKDRQVQEFFNETVKMDSGRYTVSLPWIEGHAPLEDNWGAAQRRLHSVTTRLQESGLYNDYDSVFQLWIEQGIIEVVPEKEVSQYGHYLPHRAVIKEGSTTRVRPVFDASNRDRNGNSLNKSLEKGPNLIELIPTILINFRTGKIGVSADIEKAFLMISLAEKDRDFLRFLWWKDGELAVFRHCRVVFGAAPSPYLLSAVLQHLFENADPSLSETAERLKRAFYVDNCLTSLESEEDLDRFVEDSQHLLGSVGFNLRGWVSNLKNPEKIESVLGLKWFCGSDEIGLNIKPLLGVPEPLTRRVLTSIAQRVFDPIGFSVPVSLVPKVLLQKSWSNKARWDDPLPVEICRGFMKWVEEIPYLSDCKISRRILTNETSTMHIFCDASKMAAAACIFMRTEHEGKVFVNLVMAKSRVAPPDGITIPRLELIAALIGTRLYKLVSPSFKIESGKTFFWSDSSVVVSWIKNAGPWTVFVANRINEIRSHSDSCQWRHIPGCMNPADLISRGCTPRQLREEKWWEGPSWLYLEKDFWPSSDEQPLQSEVDCEKRKTVVSATTTQVKLLSLSFLAERISCYYVIVKVVMHILEAICIICPDFISFSGLDGNSVLRRGFSSKKYLTAEVALLRSIQREYFNENVKKSALKGFTFFHDERDLIRIKTRILDEEHSEEFSCPVILPGKNPLVMRLIEYQHLINHHAGVLTLLTILRERFWLISGRQAVGMVLKRCVICRKNQARPLQVPMPPLPTDRTRPSSTYQVTGVDLAGPLFLKDKGKAWVVIFTCAVYRATHLELIQSLSTEAFVQALRRFISRRGRPKVIYSDNGTNFVGLDNLFQKIDWSVMEKEYCLQKIRWKFNPPTASWWGGFWERLIRVLKDLLKKNLGHASLEYEEMTTMLCECESIMNNRPLTYLSEDPSELAPLKPSMFIQSLMGNDVEDLDQIEATCLEKRWNYLQSVREGLKKRFSKEYLGMLCNSKPARSDKLEVGDIVLVGSDNKRRLEWPLAKVLELRPGRDGVSRLVKLLTKNGEILRPLQRIYPLEIHSIPVDAYSTDDVLCDPGSEDEKEPDNVMPADPPNEDDSLEVTHLDGCPNHEERPQEKTRSGRLVKPRQVLDL